MAVGFEYLASLRYENVLHFYSDFIHYPYVVILITHEIRHLISNQLINTFCV